MGNGEILVRDWMSSPVHVVPTDMLMCEAYDLMMRKGIRRLPVLDRGRVVGIVTIGDLREARPSKATSLSIYELNYLLARLTVAQIMTHNPFTVTPETPLREAARLMLTHKIGGLPVVGECGVVIGIITESDVFRMLMARWDDVAPRHTLAAAISV